MLSNDIFPIDRYKCNFQMVPLQMQFSKGLKIHYVSLRNVIIIPYKNGLWGFPMVNIQNVISCLFKNRFHLN